MLWLLHFFNGSVSVVRAFAGSIGIVKAFVVANCEGSPALVKELQDFTRERLAQHEFPRIVEFVKELPKNPAGKVHRKMLRDQEAAKAAASAA